MAPAGRLPAAQDAHKAREGRRGATESAEEASVAIRLKENILVHLSPPPGGVFFVFVFLFTVFNLFLGLGVFCVFLCFLSCLLFCFMFLILFLDSSRFSASIASIFVEKY